MLAVIATSKVEFISLIADVKAELKSDIAGLRLAVQTNRSEIIANRRLLGRFALHRHGDDGLPVTPLTDAMDPPEGTGDGSSSNGEGDG